MTNKKVIKNGEANTNTGFKRLVFSSDLQLRPVAYAVHSGHPPNRGTFQVAPEPDDYLVFMRWNYKSNFDELTIYQNEVPVVHQETIWRNITAIHTWVPKWIRRQPRGGIWIPFDVVPLDQYLSYINKRAQYESFVNTYGIPLLWSDWETSAKEGLRMRPGNDLGDWFNHIPQCRKGPKINTEELYYGSNGDGKSELIITDPHFTEHDSDYGSSVINTGTPIKFPRSYRFIIRVLKGGYIRNAVSYGVSVEIRKNRTIYSTTPA